MVLFALGVNPVHGVWGFAGHLIIAPIPTSPRQLQIIALNSLTVHYPNRPSAAASAAASLRGNRWPYVSAVMEILACPARSLASLSVSPKPTGGRARHHETK